VVCVIFGVIQTGYVIPGCAIQLIDQPNPDWTVARTWALFRDPADLDSLKEMAELPGLSDGWRDWAASKLGK
jgi:MOSC domain-containing protein YiiM